MKYKLLILPLLLFPFFVSAVAAYGQLNTNTYLYLSDHSTYIKFSNTLYAGKIEGYTDQIIFYDAYIVTPNEYVSESAITMIGGNVTFTRFYEGSRLKATLAGSSGDSYSLEVGVGQYGKPAWVEIDGDRQAASTGDSIDGWQQHGNTLVFNGTFSSSVTVEVSWEPQPEQPPGPSPGPSPAPSPEPTPTPPILPPAPLPPTDDPFSLMLVGGAIFVVIIVAAAVSQKKGRLSSSRRSWSQSRRKTRSPKFPKSKPVTAPKKKKEKPKKVKRRKPKNAKWKRDKSWE